MQQGGAGLLLRPVDELSAQVNLVHAFSLAGPPEEPEVPTPEDKPEAEADDLLGDDDETGAPENTPAEEPPAEEPKPDKKGKKSAETWSPC